VRNSSLVKRSCAENVTGLKPITEAMAVGGRKSEARMPEEKLMIKSYKDLEVYQESYRLAIEVYQLATRLPADANELVKQIKRASISVPLNIAEGYGKRESRAEFKRFLRMSLGSVNEIEVLVEMLKDLKFIEAQQYNKLAEAYMVLGKRINVLLNKWK
jgi:four helix bundle protein